MSPVKNTAVLSNPLMLVAELQLDARARAAYCNLTARKALLAALVRLRGLWYKVRKSECSNRPLTAVAVQIAEIKSAGGTEAEARQLSIFIDEVIADCFAGREHRTWDELDVAEEELDGREDLLTIRRRVEGESIDLIREAADIDRQHAAVQLERARYAERRVRQLERVR